MSILGTSVLRTEDPALLTVGGRYVDDVAPGDALWLTFIRSTYAHAKIIGIDATQAREADGVVSVLTSDKLGLDPAPPRQGLLNQLMTRSPLAKGTVRYVGDPIAAVVTGTREQGVDAAELVVIDYEPLPVIVNPYAALDSKPPLFPEAGSNIAFEIPGGPDEDPGFEACEVVVELRFSNQRLAPCPLEARAAAAWWDDGRLTQWSSTQGVHDTRDNLAAALNVEAADVRVVTPDVGGAFGAKSGAYVEDIVVAQAARVLGQPVRWAETRSESMIGLAHGRAQYFTARLGGTADGRIERYHLSILQDCGAYPEIGAVLPFLTKIMACGVYDVSNVEVDARSVVTNTVPVGAYRGAGRPEATAAIERMIDLYGADIDKDPAEVRRINLLEPDRFPHKTVTGAAMDTGAYEQALDAALAAADYDKLRDEQEKRRSDNNNRLLGLGLATYVEVTNPMSSSEYGSVEIRPDGSALALTGSSAHGQGHHTTFAMLVSDATGIPIERIEVRHGDTAEVPRGGGTGGSKSLQIGGSAILEASGNVAEQARLLAATLLEANPADVELDTTSGRFAVIGTPAVSVDWEAVAKAASDDGDDLRSEVDFAPAAPTFPFGAHVSVVEVDIETGEVVIIRHVACDDAGTIINPLLVEGQVHGGLAQGIAQALIEEFVFDDDGNPITANFMDYGIISAAELPRFERVPQETPTTMNPLGAKGIGESGTIGATPAVQNAVVDALSHLGVKHIEMPLTAERVWRSYQ